MTANGKGVSLGVDENILELVVMAVQYWKYTRNYQIVHLKVVKIMISVM